MTAEGLRSKFKKAFSERLLEWWRENKRDFSWRHTRDPYAVLIAEMLLRKTTAQQVERTYNMFISKYPTPEALSEADENELRDLLRPLGMEHRRAKLLVRLGKAVMEKYNGNVPTKAEDLLQLSGVGLYATNAVLSFSHSQDAPMVDTNFIRVMGRVFNLQSSKARARDDDKIWGFARALVPKGKSKEFNLAVLDFAATVCKSRNPMCDICPLTHICAFYKKKI